MENKDPLDSIKESLKQSLQEMKAMQERKLPKKSWREMMKEIREDKEKEE